MKGPEFPSKLKEGGPKIRIEGDGTNTILLRIEEANA